VVGRETKHEKESHIRWKTLSLTEADWATCAVSMAIGKEEKGAPVGRIPARPFSCFCDRKMSTLPQADFYAALCIESSADAALIKGAYRLLVRQFHPDANPSKRDEAEARIKELTQAYAVLSDPQKRANYDRDRRMARVETPSRPQLGALLTRVRMALGLSGAQCAEKLGMAPDAFSELEARDTIPHLPVQHRTFVMLLDQARLELEKRGETSAARELRADLERKRLRQAALR